MERIPITRLDAFDAVRAEWEALQRADEHATVFLSFAWLRAYLRTCAQRWRIITVRDGARLVGALPLAIHGAPHRKMPIARELSFATAPLADYQGMLCAPGCEAAVTAQLVDAVRELRWDRARFEDVRDPRIGALVRDLAPALGTTFTETKPSPCSAIALPDTWEAFLATLSKPTRRATQRPFKMFAEELPAWRTTAATGVADAEPAVDALLALNALRWGGTPARRAMYRRLFMAAFAEGCARADVVWDGERPIAAGLSFIDADRATYGLYMVGHDPQYARFSPGKALLATVVQAAIANRVRTVDFMRGGETYKQSYATHDVSNVGYEIRRRSARGRVLNAVQPAYSAARQRILRAATARRGASAENRARGAEVVRVNDLAAFDALRPAWDALHRDDPYASVFLGSAWLRAFFTVTTTPWTVLALRENDRLVAALPVSLRGAPHRRVPIARELAFATAPFADYQGLLCRPDDEARAIPLLASALVRMRWDRAVWEDVADPRIAMVAQAACAQDGSTLAELATATCSAMDLPPTFEEFIARLGRRSRRAVRGPLQSIADELPNARITAATPDDADRHIEALLHVNALRWGSTPHRTEAFRRLFRATFAEGCMRALVLWDGDRPIAASAAFVDAQRGVYGGYMSGYDPAYARLTPGKAIVAESVRDAITIGCGTFDFMRGRGPYDAWPGVRVRENHHYVSTRATVRTWALRAATPAFEAARAGWTHVRRARPVA